MSQKLESLRKKYKGAAETLADAVAKELPVGSRCCMMRAEGRQRIYGVIYAAPHAHDPERLAVKTDKRGTVLGAHFRDVQLLGGKP